MTVADDDPLLRRAIDELQRIPRTDPVAVRRVIDAAAAARVTPADDPILIETTASRRRARLWGAIGIAAAALVGFVARGAWTPQAPLQQARAAGPSPVAPLAASALRRVAAGDPSLAPIPQEFVFENGSAHRVAVVGDFNNWNPTSAAMSRSADGRLWSAMIPIAPGRHVYGFMIDDSLFVLDPRAPRTRDPDLGTDGSVLMVGRP